MPDLNTRMDKGSILRDKEWRKSKIWAVGDRNDELSFHHGELEEPVGHPSGDV